MTRRKIICKIIIRLADIQGSCRVCFSMKLAFEDLMPIAEPEWNMMDVITRRIKYFQNEKEKRKN